MQHGGRYWLERVGIFSLSSHSVSSRPVGWLSTSIINWMPLLSAIIGREACGAVVLLNTDTEISSILLPFSVSSPR